MRVTGETFNAGGPCHGCSPGGRLTVSEWNDCCVDRTARFSSYATTTDFAMANGLFVPHARGSRDAEVTRSGRIMLHTFRVRRMRGLDRGAPWRRDGQFL